MYFRQYFHVNTLIGSIQQKIFVTRMKKTIVVFKMADKICTLVTDYSSNMAEAFKTSLLGFEDTTEDGES